MKPKFLLLAFVMFTVALGAVVADSGTARAKSIAKDNVNIRTLPTTRSEILFKAPIGYPVKIEREKGKWAFLRDWTNDTGWVYKPLLCDIQTAVILVDRANVRKFAGTRYPVIGKAEKGEIYKVIEKNGRWLHLGYYFEDAPFGWVRSDLVFSH